MIETLITIEDIEIIKRYSTPDTWKTDIELGVVLSWKRERISRLRNRLGLDWDSIKIPRVCPVCNSIFIPKHFTNKFCSRKCAQHHHNRIRYKYIGNCVICGKEIPLISPEEGRKQRRVYCSHECTVVGRKRNRNKKKSETIEDWLKRKYPKILGEFWTEKNKETLFKNKYKNRPNCPRCGSNQVIKVGGKREPRTWKCKNCKRQFTVKKNDYQYPH